MTGSDAVTPNFNPLFGMEAYLTLLIRLVFVGLLVVAASFVIKPINDKFSTLNKNDSSETIVAEQNDQTDNNSRNVALLVFVVLGLSVFAAPHLLNIWAFKQTGQALKLLNGHVSYSPEHHSIFLRYL